MRCLCRALRRVWGLAAVLACGGALSLGGEPASPREPFTCLYDAPEEPAASLAEQWLAKKSGWTQLAEDDTTHRFERYSVLLNDKIVAVLHKDGPGVDLYSRQTQGMKLCARLRPVCDGSVDLKRTSLALRENNRSSVCAGGRFPLAARRDPPGDLRARVPACRL